MCDWEQNNLFNQCINVLCLIRFLFSSRLFCSSSFIRENWAMCSAVPIIIQVILWHNGHYHVLVHVWAAELVVRWNKYLCLPPAPVPWMQLKAGRGGGNSILLSYCRGACRSPPHREAPAGVPGSWAWGVNKEEGRRGHPGTKRWEAEHAFKPQGLNNYIWQCSSEAAFFLAALGIQ